MDDNPATLINASQLVSVVALVGLLSMVYAFFVAAHVALSRSHGARLRELDDDGSRRVGRARLVLGEVDRYLLVSQVGASFALLSIGIAVARSACVGDLVFPNAQASIVASCIAVAGGAVVALMAALITGRIVKAIVALKPEVVLCRISFALIVLTRILRPISFVVGDCVSALLRSVGLTTPTERVFSISVDEIAEMVERGSESGAIEPDEKEMIRGVFRISNTEVRHVMTPRKDVVSVQEDAPLADIVHIFMQEGLSRMVVTGPTLDEVRGILMAKDLIPYVGQSSAMFTLKEVIRPAYFVSTTQKIDDLLRELKREAVHFAVVLDEHGGVDGVITIEDLIEEIVGEISDEFDRDDEGHTVKRIRSGVLLIDGGLSIEDLERQHGIALPRGEYETVAGFVIHGMGKIPSIAEVFDFENFRFRVETVVNHRITALRLELPKKTKQSQVASTPGGLPVNASAGAARSTPVDARISLEAVPLKADTRRVGNDPSH